MQPFGGPLHGLAERWDGTTWSVQDVPHPTLGSALWGITWRVGTYWAVGGKFTESRSDLFVLRGCAA